MKLNKYERNIYSQCGEDGVIEEILKRLNITIGYCCEFGAWDGVFCSNTFNLIKKGWNALLIEGDEVKFNDLIKTRDLYPEQIIALNKYIEIEGENSLDYIFNEQKIEDLDLLSIDVDSNDYQLMESMSFKPKIIIIEPNSAIPLNLKIKHGESTVSYGGAGLRGSSYLAILEMGIEKGYTLVCHTGNMIFVRNDLVKNNFDDIKVNSIELYKPGAY